MNKPYRISPSFINLVMKNQPRSHGSLLPAPTDRRENLGTRLVKNKEEGGLKERSGGGGGGKGLIAFFPWKGGKS